MQLLLVIASSIALLLGLISMVTPVPGGTLLIALGLTTLIYASPKARLCIQWIRSRHAKINRVFFWLENKVGDKIDIVGKTLAKTRPLPTTVGKGLSHKQYLAKQLAQEADTHL